MKRYIVDFRNIQNMEEAHKEIEEAFEFPDYYGKNLDALSDCLSELDIDSHVYVLIYETVFDGFEDVIEVFDDKDVEYEIIIELQS